MRAATISALLIAAVATARADQSPDRRVDDAMVRGLVVASGFSRTFLRRKTDVTQNQNRDERDTPNHEPREPREPREPCEPREPREPHQSASARPLLSPSVSCGTPTLSSIDRIRFVIGV